MKTWYNSKTLWVNMLAVMAFYGQSRYGFVIDAETQAGLLAVINLFLRVITNTPIIWKNDASNPLANDSGRILAPLINMLLLAALALISACTTLGTANPQISTESPLQKAGKSLLSVKNQINVAASQVNALCASKKLTPDICRQAKGIYDASKPTYDSAVDAYQQLSSDPSGAGGGDPAAISAALIRLQDAADQLHLIAISGVAL
jgi:hypothetical protein